MTFRPRLKYFAIAITLCLIAAKALSLLTYHVFKPALTNNLQAYLLFCQGYANQNYGELQNRAAQASQLASDPDLKKVADYISRDAALHLKAGVTTFPEANSFTGGIKAIAASLSNPGLSLESTGMLVESIFIDPKKLIVQVNARYQPLLNEDRKAKLWSNQLLVASLIFGLFVAWDRRPRLLEPETTTTLSSVPESNLIVCPSCGSRNRNKSLDPGQKLVCGQCKTVLSVS
jgi:hypothetical protein